MFTRATLWMMRGRLTREATAWSRTYRYRDRDSASEVAYAIGYESASQFSREHLRQFGAPPARDVRQIRAAIGSPGKA